MIISNEITRCYEVMYALFVFHQLLLTGSSHRKQNNDIQVMTKHTEKELTDTEKKLNTGTVSSNHFNSFHQFMTAKGKANRSLHYGSSSTAHMATINT